MKILINYSKKNLWLNNEKDLKKLEDFIHEKKWYNGYFKLN